MTPDLAPPLLDFHNVRVMRGQTTALDDFCLRIGADEHVAILGPNGCGKSTLIKTITRECYPVAREGSTMSILGQDTWDVFKLRASLGIVSNDLMLSCTGDACGRDVVLSGFFSSTAIYSNHTVDPRQVEMAEAALAELQISHLADRPVSAMSSGEARRVLIARALVHKPKALLFDEPCNSLDLSAQQKVRHTMSALARSGTAIILVTHELAAIVPEVQRVVLMSKGRVAADGPKEEILQVERLAALFGVDVEMARRDGHYHLW
ncbi:MAG TPA: ATP-binding cassette domain-containing protein [Candidatus Dormibacteraeota bacterium]|nr:ATP-binding cassette domain-containing protein [Candidatus Dormibacteraeota bacterium]